MLMGNAFAYLGMIITIAGIPVKRDLQKYCYFIGPALLLLGAYLINNPVLILLEAIVTLAGLGSLLNAPPFPFSCLTISAGIISLIPLWYQGLIQINLSLTGPLGLMLIAIGVAFAQKPISNPLLFLGGISLVVFSIITQTWAWLILNSVWSIVLLRTMFFTKPANHPRT